MSGTSAAVVFEIVFQVSQIAVWQFVVLIRTCPFAYLSSEIRNQF